ncbi:hypothetical protein [Pseudomarimonas salicorniae]|uniref:Uncharacterized protein n=1 Tax=Pseudomarimonas salicorniae TaxID=2933270 RepID=A0ABT0GGA2_9GAMM|nr:hypothetical protein [Lysobacter sp. CAU 1642]MCK7593576.1 hypothetical protein [Lysobacter sp. CAU 1642]
MFDDKEDSGLLRRQKQFLQQIEFELRQINRGVIHDHIAELNRERFLELARFVAEVRSRYLEAGLALTRVTAGSEEADQALAAVERERRAYEESCAAFSALERAIERGYVDIEA